MADVVSKAVRSRMMSGIRGKDTQPELIVRRGLHRFGFRYRLHDMKLPGKPDLVLPRYNAVIFVNGCFWHGHDCHLFKWPETRKQFWRKKITGTRKRDCTALESLQSDGWRTLTIWECSLKGRKKFPVDKVLTETASWLRSRQSVWEIRSRNE